MREEILNGKLDFVGNKILDDYPEKEYEIYQFWNAVWVNYLNNQDTNGIYWYDVLGGKIYNDIVKRLCVHKWLISNALSARKWLSLELNEDKLLEFVTPDELQQVKADYKYEKYTLKFSASTIDNLVKQNNKLRDTGIVRKGIMKAGETQFGYDMDALDEYRESIKLNLTKSMDKIRHMYPEMKSASGSYDNVSVGIYDYHRKNKMEVFTTGNSISDSRGRAISNCLSKIANPIGNKDFRSALLIPIGE